MKLIDITGKAISGEWGNDCEDGNGIPVLRTTNFTDTGVINFANVVLRDIPTKDLSKKFLRPGDIIIEKSGGSDTKPVGRVVYFDSEENKYLINNFTGLLRVVDQTKWYPRYVFYALFANYSFGGTRQYENKTTGLHNLKLDQYLNSFDIPDVDFQLQHHIADTLDKVSEGIEVCRKMLEKLEVMVQSRFKEMMDSAELGDETTVEKITERVKVGFVGTCEKYYTDETGIPMIRTGNITNHGIDMRNLKYVTSEFNKRNMKSQIHNGDLLIARHGSNGQASVYEGSEAQCLNAVVIVPNQTVAKSRFLAELINSPAIKEQINRTLVGSTQNVVNTKSIANLTIRIPSLKLQEEYESYVEKIDKTKLTIQKILDKMELEKLALMQEYFK